MAQRTLARLMLFPSSIGLDGQQQVSDLALFDPDLARAVGKSRQPLQRLSIGYASTLVWLVLT